MCLTGETGVMRLIRLAIVIVLVALTGVLAGSVGTATKADAGELKWTVQSLYPYKVQIEFYSQSRRHAWPGGNQAYGLNDSETKTYSLNCRSGERICYGAWVTGNARRYWGVGARNRNSCRGCCATCDAGDTPKIVLRP